MRMRATSLTANSSNNKQQQTNRNFNCGFHFVTHSLSQSLYPSQIERCFVIYKIQNVSHTVVAHINTAHSAHTNTFSWPCSQNERCIAVYDCCHVVCCLFSGTMWATDYLKDSISEIEREWECEREWEWERIWKFSCACKQNFEREFNFTVTPWKLFILYTRYRIRIIVFGFFISFDF